MPVSMNLMGMQAESMFVAAMNKGKNFDRAATAFFKTANESGLEGNAVIALHSAVRDLSGSGIIKSRLKSEKFFNAFNEAMENGVKKSAELREQINVFFASLKKKYPNTLEVRATLARDGAVRADKVHKSTFFEKLVAGYKNLLRDDLM